ncbi:MAG: hypothetical protein CEN92_59 [Candidatus Berkelbacteria bacterium Licking1014_96]|uniref:Uncharacterized protein n=1 Tax=Candidatus Berkelbacteria bacterium Licking1014_96 TaxID=2017149 RepID=A0A554LH73_9BACT|nr:MAG: hypothetical protein CEN92_59 [Candidatus Berkelbacteria bacterium Licking1014_96]
MKGNGPIGEVMTLWELVELAKQIAERSERPEILTRSPGEWTKPNHRITPREGHFRREVGIPL